MSVFDDTVYADWADFGNRIGKLQQESEQDLVNWRTKVWPRAYKYFHCIHDRSMFEGQDVIWSPTRDYPIDKALFRPIVATQVQSAAARLGDAIGGANRFSMQPYVEDLETGAKKDELWGFANAVQSLLNTQLRYDIRWPQISNIIAREQQIYGTAVMRMEWRRMVRKGTYSWKQVPDSSDFEEQRDPNGEEVVADSLTASIVPIGAFFPDPSGRSINGEDGSQACRYTNEERTYPSDDLLARIMGAPGRNWHPDFYSGKELSREKVAKFLKQYEQEPTSSNDWLRTQQESVGKYPGRSGQTPESRRQIRALVYCEGLPDPCYAIAIGKKGGEVAILVDRDPHPNRFAPIPYALYKSIPLANELFGLAKIQWLAQVVHEINLLANVRLSGVVRAVNGFWLCNNYYNIYAANLLSMPGGAIDVKGSLSLDNALKQIPVQDNAAGLHREIDELQMFFNLAWGSTDPMMGNPTANAMDATARGVISAIEQGGVNLKSEANNLATGMVQMGTVAIGIDRQYVSRTRYVEEAGKEGADAWALQVSPTMLNRRYRIFFKPSPIITSPGSASQRYINFANSFSAAPGFPWQTFLPTAARAFELDNPDAYGKGIHETPQYYENAIYLATGNMPDARGSDNHPEHLDQLLTEDLWAHAVRTNTTGEIERHRMQHETFIQQAMQQAAGIAMPPGGNSEPPLGAPEGDMGEASLPPEQVAPDETGEIPVPVGNPSEMEGPGGMGPMGELAPQVE